MGGSVRKLSQLAGEPAEVREYREFLRIAYAGLVLRGHDRERDISDPILRKVWRLGKRIHFEESAKLSILPTRRSYPSHRLPKAERAT